MVGALGLCSCQSFPVVTKIEGFAQACRKTDLASQLLSMQRLFPGDYDFVPVTWILASHRTELERAMSEGGHTYIFKPSGGSQGQGLRLLTKFSDLGDCAPNSVVQRYISKPLLVDGYKFDCRCYVVVTAVVPLRAYLLDEGPRAVLHGSVRVAARSKPGQRMHALHELLGEQTQCHLRCSSSPRFRFQAVSVFRFPTDRIRGRPHR